jgi:hypothetical protein
LNFELSPVHLGALEEGDIENPPPHSDVGKQRVSGNLKLKTQNSKLGDGGG